MHQSEQLRSGASEKCRSTGRNLVRRITGGGHTKTVLACQKALGWGNGSFLELLV